LLLAPSQRHLRRAGACSRACRWPAPRSSARGGACGERHPDGPGSARRVNTAEAAHRASHPLMHAPSWLLRSMQCGSWGFGCADVSRHPFAPVPTRDATSRVVSWRCRVRRPPAAPLPRAPLRSALRLRLVRARPARGGEGDPAPPAGHRLRGARRAGRRGRGQSGRADGGRQRRDGGPAAWGRARARLGHAPEGRQGGPVRARGLRPTAVHQLVRTRPQQTCGFAARLLPLTPGTAK